MWTSFFELHTGPWRTSGHIKRPDTRAIEAPRQAECQKITLQNRGHPHTHLPALSRTLGSCASRGRSQESARPSWPSSFRCVLRSSGIIRRPSKGASTPSVHRQAQGIPLAGLLAFAPVSDEFDNSALQRFTAGAASDDGSQLAKNSSKPLLTFPRWEAASFDL